MMTQFYVSYHGPVVYLCLRDEIIRGMGMLLNDLTRSKHDYTDYTPTGTPASSS